MQKQLSTYCFLLLLSLTKFVQATHIVGGEIYYDCLGNNNYKITLIVYRDCSPNNTNGTGFDVEAPVGIYSGGILQNTIYFPMTGGVTNVPVVINDPCLQSPPDLCVEKALYNYTMNLPPVSAGYDLVYQRCCRNPSTINIINSSNYGASYISHIPGSGVVSCNSSPRFSTLPPLVICNGSDFVFDHSAADPDGDQLEYEFYIPFHGGDQFNPAPVPPTPPPFTTVIWSGGFSINNQISGNPGLTLNAATGLLTCKPNLNGMYVFGIKVKEIRNGVILSESYREFQTTVTNCPAAVVSEFEPQTETCTGTTVAFTNTSQFSSYFHWDFGVSGTLGDTSNTINPVFNFPDTGIYIVSLIANPGFQCADTTSRTFILHDPIIPFFAEQEPQCITNNFFDLEVTGNFSSDAIVTWDFGSPASPQSSALHLQEDITYSDSGHHLVNVTVTEFGCTGTYSDTLIVFPLPVLSFSYPLNDGCVPYTLQFTDATISWSVVSYLWDFGDGSFSNERNPVHTYPIEGIYDIALTIAIDSVCTFTHTEYIDSAITVHASPFAGVRVSPEEVGIYDPEFTVYDESEGGIQQTIILDDGYQTNEPFFEYVFFNSGYHPISQVVINEFGCTDTASTVLFLRPETTVFVPNAFTPDGDGLNDVFIPVIYDVSEYLFIIYNRWGEVIFSSTELLTGWDGTREGKLCPQDVYVYRIVYSNWEGITRQETGHFTLAR